MLNMNILAIGNSFSDDATRYLHQIARADGLPLNVVSLYIGGCSLATHHQNMLSGEKAYELVYNGESTGFPISLKEALLNRSWDAVTFQQASHDSTKYSTYQPYLQELSAYVKQLAPDAEQMIHQTWAYEQGSDRLSGMMGYTDQADMFLDLQSAYKKAAASIGASRILPSGLLFQILLSNGIEKVHRDTFHASLGLGRYALALLWYAVLTGRDVSVNTFCDFDEPVSPEKIAIVKQCVTKTAPAAVL